ncbi:MAG TPA: hypothetical protein VFA20_15895 [Myxococcaceae bacterium]|nr:hypothetical protein [Myxococcaceae bacterium]
MLPIRACGAAVAVLLLGGARPSPLEAQLAKDFPGWTVDEKAQGDLNGDSVKDWAVTLKRPSEGGAGRLEPMLAIYLGTKGGGLELHTRAPRAVCIGCGGVKSSPDGVIGVPTITPRGVLELAYEGGSREAWSDTHKWRYDAGKDAFELIGRTYVVRDTLSEDGHMEPGEMESEDINFSTGKMVRTLSGKGAFTCKVKPGVASAKLAEFDYEHFTDIEQLFVDGSCKK